MNPTDLENKSRIQRKWILAGCVTSIFIIDLMIHRFALLVTCCVLCFLLISRYSALFRVSGVITVCFVIALYSVVLYTVV